MKTTIADRTVEWDEEKNELNEKKHGIDFSTAATLLRSAWCRAAGAVCGWWWLSRERCDNVLFAAVAKATI